MCLLYVHVYVCGCSIPANTAIYQAACVWVFLFSIFLLRERVTVLKVGTHHCHVLVALYASTSGLFWKLEGTIYVHQKKFVYPSFCSPFLSTPSSLVYTQTPPSVEDKDLVTIVIFEL